MDTDATDPVSLTATQEVFLGVVTPALSDLTASTRHEAILDADDRPDAEVAGRWAHLTPVVQAFYDRMGVLPPVDTSPAVVENEPEALPPVPAPLESDPAEAEQVELFSDESWDEGPEQEQSDLMASPPLPEDEQDEPETPSRVDVESHDRLQTDGTGPGLEQAARRLYDDVLWLFTINDGEGALISLERLLTIGQIDDEVSEFLDLNGDKLVGLYEGYIGPFDKIPVRGETPPEAMPNGYLSQGALEGIFGMIDGQRSIADLIDASDITPLETCASIEQLHRARLVEL